MVIYIPTQKYKYMVITESDTILQEYYITRKYKSTIHEEIYITKTERCSRAAREASRANQEKSWKSYGDVQASAVLRSPQKDPLRTLISYSKATMVQTLGSGHKDPGLADATQRVHMIKPSGMHIRHTCTGKVYREYKHI